MIQFTVEVLRRLEESAKELRESNKVLGTLVNSAHKLGMEAEAEVRAAEREWNYGLELQRKAEALLASARAYLGIELKQ